MEIGDISSDLQYFGNGPIYFGDCPISIVNLIKIRNVLAS